MRIKILKIIDSADKINIYLKDKMNDQIDDLDFQKAIEDYIQQQQ